MLWWHRCWVLETNKLFLESKIESDQRTRDGRNQKNESWFLSIQFPYSRSSIFENILSTFLLFALFVQSLFQFAWSSGQLTESLDKLMQQWEYDLWAKWKDKFREHSDLVLINKVKSWKFEWPSESRASPLRGMAMAACIECQNVWHEERRE